MNAEKKIVNSDFNLKLGKIQCEGKINKQTQKKIQKSKIQWTDRKPEFVEFTNSEFVKKGIFKFGDFFFESFFMGGAIHPFPKIMRGEMAFFFGGGGGCNSPLPKNY